MTQSFEFQIPGTKTKVPGILLLGGGLVIAFIVLMQRGESGAPFKGEELLASELDQRLREQWEALARYLADSAMESGNTGLPITPPAVPVTPAVPRYTYPVTMDQVSLAPMQLTQSQPYTSYYVAPDTSYPEGSKLATGYTVEMIGFDVTPLMGIYPPPEDQPVALSPIKSTETFILG